MMSLGSAMASRLAARAMLLTPPNYITIRGSSTTLSIIQGDEEWLDVSPFVDLAAWIDVIEVQRPTGGVVLLQLETSPTGDESTFIPVIGPVSLSPTTTPIVLLTASASNTPLSKVLRWRLLSTGSSTWDATIRIRVMGNRTRYFAPTQLGNCVYWLRPDCGLGFSGTGIHTWSERATSDPNKKLTTSANSPVQPTYTQTTPGNYNNQPSVLMGGGSNAFMTSPSWTTPLSQPDTWVVVGNPQTTGVAQVTFESNDTVSGQNVQQNASNQIQVATTSSLISTTQWTTPGVVLAEFNGSSSNIFFDNFTTAVKSGAVGTGSNTGQNSLTLGSSDAAFHPSGAAFWNGPIFEIMAFSSVLTAAQKGLLRSYLSNRYGIAIG